MAVVVVVVVAVIYNTVYSIIRERNYHTLETSSYWKILV